MFCTGIALHMEIGVLKLGNEWLVVLGGLQPRFTFQVLAALRAFHCNRV